MAIDERHGLIGVHNRDFVVLELVRMVVRMAVIWHAHLVMLYEVVHDLVERLDHKNLVYVCVNGLKVPGHFQVLHGLLQVRGNCELFLAA